MAALWLEPTPLVPHCLCSEWYAFPLHYIDPAARIQWEYFSNPDPQIRQAARILGAAVFHEQGLPGSHPNRYWPLQFWRDVFKLDKEEPFGPRIIAILARYNYMGKGDTQFPHDQFREQLQRIISPHFVSKFTRPHDIVFAPLDVSLPEPCSEPCPLVPGHVSPLVPHPTATPYKSVSFARQ